jgi:hypothetical protein
MPCFGALTVERGANLAHGDPSQAGYGGGLPRIAYSRKCALDVAIFDASNIPCFDTLTLDSDVHLVRETGAERGMAADCLALRIRDFRASTSSTPWFGALTVHSGAYLARGDPSRA